MRIENYLREQVGCQCRRDHLNINEEKRKDGETRLFNKFVA